MTQVPGDPSADLEDDGRPQPRGGHPGPDPRSPYSGQRGEDASGG